jgi:hypothetical protein
MVFGPEPETVVELEKGERADIPETPLLELIPIPLLIIPPLP